MEYILMLLVAVLVGLVWMRKRPSRCNSYYWGVLGAIIAYQVAFCPYRLFRVFYDLGHLVG